MKKKNLNLKRLTLTKETIAGLNAQMVTGGGLTDTCPATGPCCQNTFQLSCAGSCINCPTQQHDSRVSCCE